MVAPLLLLAGFFAGGLTLLFGIPVMKSLFDFKLIAILVFAIIFIKLLRGNR